MYNTRNKRIKQETRLCLLFILRTGLRINEALSLKGVDLMPFDNPPSFYLISKGGNPAQMPIPDDMVEEMKQRVTRQRVFEAREETCNKNLRDGVKKLDITLEEPITCHKLRDIFSLSRLRRGNALQLVSRSLRHSSVSITDKYYSNYVLTDIVPVINDSPLIKKNLPVKDVVGKAITAFTSAIGNDDRIKMEVNQDSDGNAVITVRQT